MKYLFKNKTTMKPYNRKHYYVDADIVPNMEIEADNIATAVRKFQARVNDMYSVSISDTAVKRKQKLFIDDEDGNAVQVGYVFTGKMNMVDEDYSSTAQYLDIWTEIEILNRCMVWTA